MMARDVKSQLRIAASSIGLVLKEDDRIWPLGNRRRAIDARTAQVAVSDSTGNRLTVTRAMTLGLFALGAKKRTGKFIVFITGPDGQIEVKVDPKHGERAQRFATLFNVVYPSNVDDGVR